MKSLGLLLALVAVTASVVRHLLKTRRQWSEKKSSLVPSQKPIRLDFFVLPSLPRHAHRRLAGRHGSGDDEEDPNHDR